MANLGLRWEGCDVRKTGRERETERSIVVVGKSSCLVRFWSIAILVRLGLAIECLLDHIEEAAHAYGTEEVLERHEWVRYAQQHGAQLNNDWFILIQIDIMYERFSTLNFIKNPIKIINRYSQTCVPILVLSYNCESTNGLTLKTL